MSIGRKPSDIRQARARESEWAPGRLVKGLGNDALAKQDPPACGAASLRQEVSEPIRLGPSSRRERSRWEVPEAIQDVSACGLEPLTGDLSTGRAPATHARKGVRLDWTQRSHPREELRRWATIGAVRGVRTFRCPCS